MAEQDLMTLGVNILFCIVGLSVHIAKKFLEHKSNTPGVKFSFSTYIMKNPVQNWILLVGCVMGLVLMYETGAVSLYASFLTGVSANSIADIGGGRQHVVFPKVDSANR